MGYPIGEWIWDASTERLGLSISEGPLKSVLNGAWSLQDVGKVLDGLSHKALTDALEMCDTQVGVDLQTAEGARIHLAGASIGANTTRGVILSSVSGESVSAAPSSGLAPSYQPIIDLRTQAVAGFEALARWEDGKARSPEALAEAQALASNMLIKAAEALVCFRSISGAQNLFMHVNVTSMDLVDENLTNLVSALCSGYDLASGSLRLELTEQAALRDTEQSLKRIQDLKAVGAGLVLDDFGSGHSSFLWLADLPADSLKIDASLIQQLDNPRVETILEALTLMSRRLGMTVTAEGVEDIEMMPKLSRLGFDYAQGYALGRPLPVDGMEAFLRP